jgi:DNA adenine methylase
LFIEPFLGGGIISLTVAFESLADSVLMIELDEEIAAVWQTIMDGDSEWLAKRILEFELTKESAVAELSIARKGTRQKAFQTIIKNRTFHGGILAAGSGFLKNGEAGRGIRSRWYPETLARRLRDINFVRQKLVFYKRDAFEVLQEERENSDAAFFIDPPYTAGGKKAGSRLYTHHEMDHDRLFEACSKLAGDFVMTYDNADEVKALAKAYGFQAKPISMKNTHHAEMKELVIGRNLDWMDGVERVCEEEHAYKHQTRNQTQADSTPRHD